jgi:biotin carboxyl carrier protein
VKLVITVDGKTYQVEVKASEPGAPHPTYVPPTTVRAAGAQTTAPRSGQVASLTVAMGDAVRAGQVLVELA